MHVPMPYVIVSNKAYLPITSLGTKTKKETKRTNQTTQSIYFSTLAERAVNIQALCCTPQPELPQITGKTPI